MFESNPSAQTVLCPSFDLQYRQLMSFYTLVLILLLIRFSFYSFSTEVMYLVIQTPRAHFFPYRIKVLVSCDICKLLLCVRVSNDCVSVSQYRPLLKMMLIFFLYSYHRKQCSDWP